MIELPNEAPMHEMRNFKARPVVDWLFYNRILIGRLMIVQHNTLINNHFSTRLYWTEDRVGQHDRNNNTVPSRHRNCSGSDVFRH